MSTNPLGNGDALQNALARDALEAMRTRETRMLMHPLDWPQGVDATTYANERIRRAGLYFFKWGLGIGAVAGLICGVLVGKGLP